jgi:hypothetical protein
LLYHSPIISRFFAKADYFEINRAFLAILSLI